MTRAIKLTNDRSKIFSSRRTLAFAAFGLLGVLTAAQVAAQSEPFRIGAVYAVTGPASFLGDAEAKAALDWMARSRMEDKALSTLRDQLTTITPAQSSKP